jgi:hypothetical protein
MLLLLAVLAYYIPICKCWPGPCVSVTNTHTSSIKKWFIQEIFWQMRNCTLSPLLSSPSLCFYPHTKTKDKPSIRTKSVLYLHLDSTHKKLMLSVPRFSFMRSWLRWWRWWKVESPLHQSKWRWNRYDMSLVDEGLLHEYYTKAYGSFCYFNPVQEMNAKCRSFLAVSNLCEIISVKEHQNELHLIEVRTRILYLHDM